MNISVVKTLQGDRQESFAPVREALLSKASKAYVTVNLCY